MLGRGRRPASPRGGGYRDSESQIAPPPGPLRHSDYAIYEMPPSPCQPADGPPGQSMHERGLAIDFTCNSGRLIGASSPCFQWLGGQRRQLRLHQPALRALALVGQRQLAPCQATCAPFRPATNADGCVLLLAAATAAPSSSLLALDARDSP